MHSHDRDEGVTTRGGGTCGRASEGLEAVEVVWSCLACFPRSCRLPVADSHPSSVCPFVP